MSLSRAYFRPDFHRFILQVILQIASLASVCLTSIFAQQDISKPLGTAIEDPRNPIAELFGGERIDLWSLRPIQDSNPPQRLDGNRPDQALGHPIDRFLADRFLAERSIIQAPSAAVVVSKEQLLQRVTLDLIGLRASNEEVASYLEDRSPQAFDAQVDRLLGDPRFGEHWARMWLDTVRYSDSNGFDWDEYRKQAWKYRDFVVRAFNEDLPYDQFVLWQLAGDELSDSSTDSDSQVDRWIATGYLRLGPFDNAAKLFNEQDRARSEVLTDLTETTGAAFLGLTLSCCRCHDHKTDPLSQQDHYRFRAFFAAIKFDESTTESNQTIDAMLGTDDPNQIEAIHVLEQGNHRKPLEEVQPGFPSVLFPNAPQIEQPAHGRTIGRRLALARWIVSKDNPWTARVIVNRIWQGLFGQGLVATPNDFGVTGSPPVSRELLDHLAVYLVDHNWSIKSLIRYIVTSEAYSEPIGPTRKLRRLSAEQMRDVVLQTTGMLQHRNGGRPVWPPVSMDALQANPAVLDDNETKTKGWYPSPDHEQTVRSLYLIQKRTVRIPWMETFDLPENTVSCARRDVSIVSSQALALLNADWVWESVKRLTEELSEQPVDRIEGLFERILSRKPTAAERHLCSSYLDRGRSLAELALVLVNSNELAFIP